jgi:hypothetical protein
LIRRWLNVEEKDEEYEDLQKAERKAKRDKKKINYRFVEPSCCLTCKKSGRMSCEDDLECSEITHDRWAVNRVDDLGLCDKYAARADPRKRVK